MAIESPNISVDKDVTSTSALLFLVIGLFPFAVFGLCWFLFAITITDLYWLSAIIAIFVCIMGYGLIWREIEDNLFLRIPRLRHPGPLAHFLMSLSMAVSSIFAFLTFSAWISFTLYRLDLLIFFSTTTDISYSSFVRTYAWHLIDLIPFSNIDKTFGLEVPEVKFSGWTAGFPVLIFRFLVVFITFNTFREAWKVFRERYKSEVNK